MKKTTLWLAVSLVCWLTIPATFAQGQGLNKDRVCAHRGITGTYPENCAGSIKAAMDLGIFGSEVDLRTSMDGRLVLLHDDFLDRCTTGQGKVSEKNLEQLKALFLKDGTGKVTQQKILTLKEALDLVRPDPDFILTLDLKDADPVKAGRIVLAEDMADQVYFFIADPLKETQTAKALKALNPGLKIAVDLLTWWKIQDLPTFVITALDADALFASEWFFPRCGFEEARQAGAKVFVYLWGTHDLKQRAEKAIALGADVVSCDRPTQLIE